LSKQLPANFGGTEMHRAAACTFAVLLLFRLRCGEPISSAGSGMNK